MGVTNQYSAEYTAALITVPKTHQPVSTYNGKLQLLYFSHDQSGAGDATSDVLLGVLPAGRVRLILPLSWAYFNWTTGSATCDLGWGAYTGLDGVEVVADPNGLSDGLDVDAVGIRQLSTGAVAAVVATGYTKVFTSKTGVPIIATSQDQALGSGDDLAGVLAYICD